MRFSGRLLFLFVFILFIISSTACSESVSLEITPKTAYVDKRLRIVLDHCRPFSTYTIDMYQHWGTNLLGHSTAEFKTGFSGRIDLNRTAPSSGSYHTADSMGLFWSRTAETNLGDIPDYIKNSTNSYRFYFEVKDSRNRTVAINTFDYISMIANNDIKYKTISNNNFLFTLYQPSNEGKYPALLILHGSEGGKNSPFYSYAANLARYGYVTLAVSYFGKGNLPPYCVNIPLEYLQGIIRWVKQQPIVDLDKIGAIGFSQGGQLDLLLGSVDPDIKAVVSYCGSGLVRDSYAGNYLLGSMKTSWTWQGKPIVKNTIIKVENINGPVLLIGAGDDRMQEPAIYLDTAYYRLTNFHHPFDDKYLLYKEAGHGIWMPFWSTAPRYFWNSYGKVQMGGTPEATAHANEDSWSNVLEFLSNTFYK